MMGFRNFTPAAILILFGLLNHLDIGHGIPIKDAQAIGEAGPPTNLCFIPDSGHPEGGRTGRLSTEMLMQYLI